MSPVKIKINDKEKLYIKWDDDFEGTIQLMKLRRNCPCAVCQAEKDEQSSTYIPIFTLDQLKVTSMNIVGHYALAVAWKDGHNTGIYEFKQLRNLSEELVK